jgi:predicted nucleic acid-binding protein
MSGKVFVDTNIFVYAADTADNARRQAARLALARLRQEHGVVSTQVMQECYACLTSKLRLPPLAARAIVQSMGRFEVVTLDAAAIETAIDIHILHPLSFWDALLFAAAERAGCQTLWTEDMSPGQVVRGVRIVNPLL